MPNSAMTPQVTFQQLIEDGVLQIGDGYRAKNEELGGAGLIFLRAGHVTDTHIDFDGVDRFREPPSGVEAKLSKPGDVVVTTKGNSTGRVSFVSAGMPQFVYSPHLSFWRSLDSTRLRPEFLRYWSRGREFRDQLAGLSASTDMAPYLSLSDQRRLRITLPTQRVQQSIGELLLSLDDKIDLNRRMNQTLEAVAQALFKSWFVDFDPVRAKAEGRQPEGMDPETAALFPDTITGDAEHEVPRGWRTGTLGEVATVVRRQVEPSDLPPETPYIGLEHMPRGSICLDEWETAAKVTSGKLTFKRGQILFGKLRPYFKKVGVALVDGVCSSDILVLDVSDRRWASWLLGHVTRQEFIDYCSNVSSGTRMPRASWEDVARFSVPMPQSTSVVAAYDELVGPMLERIRAAALESRSLAALRDALLPKLLSGEVRLGDAHDAVAKAV